ncbi:MAG: carboxypeptidase regulatory-like domain-containing protein, partial [Candidatus Sumerlaeia bacterium]|nr:carboxypeptidase regulatory-like domain-containing protein [Candidatus Sumerlaeia bacterium]
NRMEHPGPGGKVGILVGSSNPSSPLQDPYDAFPIVETDENGIFEFEAAPRGKLVMIHAKHREYLPNVLEVAAPSESESKIVLRKGEASVRGRVLDAQGRPMNNAAVETIFRPGGPGWRTQPPFPDLDTQFVRTDEEGYFEFPAVRAGWQTLVATSDNPAIQSTGNSTLLNVGESKTVTLKFDPALTINGVVVDAATEEPIQGVQIAKPDGSFGAPAGNAPVDSIVTGFDGRFTLETYSQVRGGVFRVPGLHYKLPSHYGHDAAEWQTHNVRIDRLQSGEEVRITVTPTLLLEGTVFLADGVTPVAGVGVDFRPEIGRARGLQLMPDPDIANAQSQTGPDGRFKISVPPEARGFLLARSTDGYHSSQYEVAAEGPLEPVELTLSGFSSVSGTVSGPDGEPVYGAEVTLRQAAGRRGTADSATTGADGTYIIEEIYGTRGFLAVSPPEDMAMVSPDPRMINLSEGEDLEGQDFELLAAALFEGVVVDEEGNPIEGALLSRRVGRWRAPDAPSVESDAQGRFTFNDMDEDARTFTLEARHPGYDDVNMGNINVEDSPVTVEMRARASVSLTASEPGGNQVTSFEYQFALDSSTRGRDRRTNVEGRVINQTAAVTETLSPGTYRVHVYPLSESGERTGAYGFENFEVTDGGETAEVRVEIGDSVTLRGQVVDADGRGLEGVEVRMTVQDEARPRGNQWRRVEGGNRRTVTSDTRGNFEFAYTTPGTLRFEAELEDYVMSDEVEVVLESGQRPELVEIRMHQGARVHGVVTGPDGRPASGMTVRLGTGFRDPTETTDSSGEYVFANVSPGRYAVTLLSGTNAVIERQNVTINMESQEVDFSLEGLIQVEGTLRRNGQRDRSRFFQLELAPLRGAQASRTTLTVGNGQFEHFLAPGVYSVEIPVTGSSTRAITGETFTVEERPYEQRIDIDLELVNVGIVIVDANGDEFSPGTMRLEHRPVGRQEDNGPGPWTLEMDVSDSLFYVDNLPTGESRAVFTTNGGIRFDSDWTVLGADRENILTLIPENL